MVKVYQSAWTGNHAYTVLHPYFIFHHNLVHKILPVLLAALQKIQRSTHLLSHLWLTEHSSLLIKHKFWCGPAFLLQCHWQMNLKFESNLKFGRQLRNHESTSTYTAWFTFWIMPSVTTDLLLSMSSSLTSSVILPLNFMSLLHIAFADNSVAVNTGHSMILAALCLSSRKKNKYCIYCIPHRYHISGSQILINNSLYNVKNNTFLHSKSSKKSKHL